MKSLIIVCYMRFSSFARRFENQDLQQSAWVDFIEFDSSLPNNIRTR